MKHTLNQVRDGGAETLLRCSACGLETRVRRQGEALVYEWRPGACAAWREKLGALPRCVEAAAPEPKPAEPRAKARREYVERVRRATTLRAAVEAVRRSNKEKVDFSSREAADLRGEVERVALAGVRT